MTKVTQTQNNPAYHWLLGGNPKAIEKQEAKGQQELINASQLPVKANDFREPDAKAAYKKMGIRVYPFSVKIARIFKRQIAQIDNDPLFVPVILPDGWKIEATDHSMWSNLLDDKGRVRAEIFYKAAFYDRSAHIRFLRRYAIIDQFVTKDFNDARRRYVVKDYATGEHLFETEIRACMPSKDDQIIADKWLTDHFPLFADLTAYWD